MRTTIFSEEYLLMTRLLGLVKDLTSDVKKMQTTLDCMHSSTLPKNKGRSVVGDSMTLESHAMDNTALRLICTEPLLKDTARNAVQQTTAAEPLLHSTQGIGSPLAGNAVQQASAAVREFHPGHWQPLLHSTQGIGTPLAGNTVQQTTAAVCEFPVEFWNDLPGSPSFASQ